MSKLQLPKDYLSYSAMELWLRDRESYRKRYYEGEPWFSTPYTEFGNKVGEALETGEFFDPILEQVPRGKIMEHKIHLEIAGVPVLGYLDSFTPEDLKILEYKTGIRTKEGKVPWDRVKVRKHKQLTIYALLVRAVYGTYNPDVDLIWMETKWSTIDKEVPFGNKTFNTREKGLKLAGHVETFTRHIEPWELDRQEELIRTIAEQISEDYKLWKKT